MDGLDLDFFIRPGIKLLVENEEFTTIINLPKGVCFFRNDAEW